MMLKNVMELFKIHTDTHKAVYYRLACDCGDPECDMTLELEKDLSMIFVNFYKNLSWSVYWGQYDNWFKRIYARIICSLKMFFTGRVEVAETFIMKESQIEGFKKALDEGMRYLKEEHSKMHDIQ